MLSSQAPNPEPSAHLWACSSCIDVRLSVYTSQVVQNTDAASDFGVLVYADGLVHSGRQVCSADPAHSGTFRSYPGPVGEARGGQTVSTPFC